MPTLVNLVLTKYKLSIVAHNEDQDSYSKSKDNCLEQRNSQRLDLNQLRLLCSPLFFFFFLFYFWPKIGHVQVQYEVLEIIIPLIYCLFFFFFEKNDLLSLFSLQVITGKFSIGNVYLEKITTEPTQNESCRTQEPVLY